MSKPNPIEFRRDVVQVARNRETGARSGVLSPHLGTQVVIWGLRTGDASHRYIHAGWFRTLKEAGFKVRWLDDFPTSRQFVPRNSVIFCVDIASKWLPVRADCHYVMHNLDDKILGQRIAASSRSHVNLQVWTAGVLNKGWREIMPAVHWDSKARKLYQPWGTPFAPSTWWHPDESLPRSTNSVEFWIGSIWDNALGQGNAKIVSHWKRVLAGHGIAFEPTSRTVADRVREYGEVTSRSAIAASIVGRWQRDMGYLPCRLFKNLSCGRLPVSNGNEARRIFGDLTITSPSLEMMLESYGDISPQDERNRVLAAQELLRGYTYEAFLSRTLDALLS